MYVYTCLIPNGFRDRAISLWSTLYTVETSNTPCPHTSAFMLTVEFSKMYYTTKFAPCLRFISILSCNLSLELPCLFSNFCSLLDTNILSRIVFSNTPSLYPSLNIKDRFMTKQNNIQNHKFS
jgi:hypothetical protein